MPGNPDAAFQSYGNMPMNTDTTGKTVQKNKPGRSHKGIIIALVVVVIFLMMIIAALAGGSSGENHVPATAESSTETVESSENSDSENLTVTSSSVSEDKKPKFERPELDANATADDFIGTWTLDHYFHDGKLEDKESLTEHNISESIQFDQNGNYKLITEDDNLTGTYEFSNGMVALDSGSLSLSLRKDGTLEFDLTGGDYDYFVKTSLTTDIEPTINDEFDQYASYLPGTYKVLGTMTEESESIMPLSETEKLLTGVRLTEESVRQVEDQANFSFVITSDEKNTLVDYDGTTSSGSIAVSGDQIYLDGEARFQIYGDGSLTEDTDYGQTLVLVKDYLIEEKTQQILGTGAYADSSAGTDNSNGEQAESSGETVIIDGTEFKAGDTIECDCLMALEVATGDDTYFGTLKSFDQQTSYVTVMFKNGLSDITCDNSNALYLGTDLEVYEVYITDIADSTSAVPMVYGQIVSSHVLAG